MLGLGSPTHPLPEESYAAWTRDLPLEEALRHEFLYAGPLFIHQLSHVWIDFRGIQDEFMRERGIDYFENSRRATYVQQQYAIRNPKGSRATASSAGASRPATAPARRRAGSTGVERRFYDYRARGVPYGPDDGTIAPWAAVASLPFAPEIVLPTIAHFDETYPEMMSKYGFKCSFNPTFAGRVRTAAGISQGYYGLDQGPIVLMIENYRSGLLWSLMRQCPYLVGGLRRAGFDGGWLSPT